MHCSQNLEEHWAALTGARPGLNLQVLFHLCARGPRGSHGSRTHVPRSQWEKVWEVLHGNGATRNTGKSRKQASTGGWMTTGQNLMDICKEIWKHINAWNNIPLTHASEPWGLGGRQGSVRCHRKNAALPLIFPSFPSLMKNAYVYHTYSYWRYWKNAEQW